jgi:hypothetical protein
MVEACLGIRSASWIPRHHAAVSSEGAVVKPVIWIVNLDTEADFTGPLEVVDVERHFA